MKVRTTMIRLRALTLAAALFGLGVPAVSQAPNETPTETASMTQPLFVEASSSVLTGISLPPSAMRLTSPNLLAQFAQKLQGIAQQYNKQSVEPNDAERKNPYRAYGNLGLKRGT